MHLTFVFLFVEIIKYKSKGIYLEKNQLVSNHSKLSNSARNDKNYAVKTNICHFKILQQRHIKGFIFNNGEARYVGKFKPKLKQITTWWIKPSYRKNVAIVVQPHECHLDGKCLTESLGYKALVTMKQTKQHMTM